MKELLLTILATFNTQALPDIDSVEWISSDYARGCLVEVAGSGHGIDKCKSQQYPGQTFHIYESTHIVNTFTGESKQYSHSDRVYLEHVNVFVRNGEVFEIPMDELFNFYQIK